jgi:hypothetical protein
VNKLPLLLLSTALLAACGTAAGSSGSAGLRDTSNVGSVRVSQAANAEAETEVNRNLPVTKGTHPVPLTPAQAQTAAPKSVQSPTPVDRCNGGLGTGQGAGNRAAAGSGKAPFLPACPPQ